MKKLVSIIIILFIGHFCFGQAEEKNEIALTYSVGLAYNQIWLQSTLYGANEYSVFSSPFNWGVSPFFSLEKNRWKFNISCSYLSFSRNEQFSETRILQDKWQEASLASTVGFRLTGEHSLINVTPFLGFDLCSLINYEKTVTYGTWTRHYNTKELGARDPYHFFSYYLGIGLLGGINVSYPIAKRFEIGLSYCFKYKIVNNIRSDHNPHYAWYVTSPIRYHNASIGVSYRFN